MCQTQNLNYIAGINFAARTCTVFSRQRLQEVVMSLAYSHVTDLFLLGYRGATVMKFGL